MCDPGEFAHFNVFNGHFFHGDAAFRSWCSNSGADGADVALFVDPPFGGRLDALAKTIDNLKNRWLTSRLTVKGKFCYKTYNYFRYIYEDDGCSRIV
jgi:hypothetical protein